MVSPIPGCLRRLTGRDRGRWPDRQRRRVGHLCYVQGAHHRRNGAGELMSTGDVEDIFGRLRGYLPTRWFGSPSDSKPIRDAVLVGFAVVLSYLHDLYVYAKLQTRLATMTDGWLDMFAAD